MRVLVTGGCGFIGSHFVRRLVVGGDDVVVLDKLTYAGSRARLDGVEYAFLHGDIADSSMVRRAAEGCDAVVNFAAETHVDRSILDAASFIHTDVLGTRVLLESARAAGTRFIQVSTDEVYGDIPLAASADEDHPLRPSNPYSASKAAADLLVLAYVRTYEVDASITRGGNTYGPYQHPEKLIPLFVTNALTGLPLPLYGDGGQRRQWLHVEDHVAAIELVLRRGERGAVYNIGGEEKDNASVTELILRLTDADASLVRHVADRPGHDRRYSVDSTRIRALGWAPRAPFEDGIAATVAWYRERRDWWEPIKSGEYADYYEAQYGKRFRGALRAEGAEVGGES
jgi:dTDP-glucose 4,6-dehydratase